MPARLGRSASRHWRRSSSSPRTALLLARTATRPPARDRARGRRSTSRSGSRCAGRSCSSTHELDLFVGAVMALLVGSAVIYPWGVGAQGLVSVVDRRALPERPVAVGGHAQARYLNIVITLLDRHGPRDARLVPARPAPAAQPRADVRPALREPGEERVPRQHEPRDPHADERGDRHDRASARHAARRASSASCVETIRTSGDGLLAHHQRHARLLQDRGRADRARERRLRPARRASRTRSTWSCSARATRASSCSTCATRRTPATHRRRRRAAAPGAGEPAQQRDQVHRSRRGDARRVRDASCRT